MDQLTMLIKELNLCPATLYKGNGVFLYRDQVNKLFQLLGYETIESDVIIKALMKKNNPQLEEYYSEFESKNESVGIQKDISLQLWEILKEDVPRCQSYSHILAQIIAEREFN